MIRKKIHYCWFGKNPLPENLKKYMESWKKYCPDYEIKEWNEDNFDVNSHPFTKSAYEEKKWAFVSDYVRAYALFTEGGIYLDTDVEIKANLDSFLEHEAFTCFETQGYPVTTAFWGSEKNHSLAKKVLAFYENKIYTKKQEPNTASLARILIEDFKIDPYDNVLQLGSDSLNTIHIYPAEYFCLDLPTSFASHHFEGSWLENEELPYKATLHAKYYLDKFLKEADAANKDNLKAKYHIKSLQSISRDENFYIDQLASSLRSKSIIKIMAKKISKKFTKKR